MKVILLQELKGKGGEGDVIDVAPGFANNYLYRRGIAMPATKGNLKQLEQRRHNIEKREATRLAEAEKLKAVLDGLEVKVDAKVGDEGQLFGSVTSQMVVDGIKAAADVDIDRRRVENHRPIKVSGVHEMEISLYRDIKATVKLLVGVVEAAEEEADVPAAEAVEEVVASADEATEEAAE